MNHRHDVPPRASLTQIRSPQTQRTTEEHAVRLPQTRPPADVWDDEDEQQPDRRVPHLGRSAIRYSVAEQHPERQLAPLPPPRVARKQWHPLLYIGVGMLGAAVLAIVFLEGGGWWQQQTDTWTYGYPRTAQTDAVVGHMDSASHPSHFLAENLRGQILVIEFPGGDPSRGRDFLITTLFGSGNDLAPVTLIFRDVNGDGKPDLLVHVEGQIIVYLNDQGTFRPLKPGEQVEHIQ